MFRHGGLRRRNVTGNTVDDYIPSEKAGVLISAKDHFLHFFHEFELKHGTN